MEHQRDTVAADSTVAALMEAVSTVVAGTVADAGNGVHS
jgi:hypothetical protein